MISDNDKILTLEGIAYFFQPPSREFRDKGTLQEFKDQLLNKPFVRQIVKVGDTATHYSAKVGEYLFETLDYENISDVVGTLDGVNKWLRDTGGVAHDNPSDRYFCMYSAIESEEFKQAPRSERVGLIVNLSKELTDESVKDTSRHYLGSQFLGNNSRLIHDIWLGKYPTLEKDVTNIWNQEVCEKVAFPYLEKQL